MTRRSGTTPVEVTVTDGTRHIGRVVVVDNEHRAYDADDAELGTFPTRRDAQRAVFEADRVGAAR